MLQRWLLALVLGLVAGLGPAPAQAQVHSPAAVTVVAGGVETELETAPRWIQERLPQAFLRLGPKGLLWWQWGALALLFAAAWASGAIASALTHLVVERRRKKAAPAGERAASPFTRFRRPFAFTWGLGVVYLALPSLALHPGALAFVERVLRAGFLWAVFWAALRGVDLAFDRGGDVIGAPSNVATRAFAALGARATKMLLIAVAAISVLSELGYQVTSLIAGLSVGGVALAFAAQKTVENLFGSVSIGIDQPFHVGDYIKVDDLSGTVEGIGLRSTRIRTDNRTVVTFPNGKLADARVERVTARDKIHLACKLALSRDVTAAEVRTVLAGIDGLLGRHPKVAPGFAVTLNRIGESSLDVGVDAYLTTTDDVEFGLLRQEILLGFLEQLERAGVQLAFPTRTLYLERDKPVAGGK